jgi:hypothetical protein
VAIKAKCGRCSGKWELVQAPHRGTGWAICARCLADVLATAAGHAQDEPPVTEAA